MYPYKRFHENHTAYFLLEKNCSICIIKMAISLGRENSLHAEERKCQTGEQSICSREGYNYLMHLNTTGH